MIFNLEQSDHQNLIYSLVLLTFLIGSVIVHRELKLGQALKYLIIWGIVAFIGVALYAYRFEFQDFKSRIVGEINPESARLDQENRIVINLSRDGHFYVDLKINDEQVRFMIDTGASDIVLNMTDAQRIGIDIKNLVFDKRYQTANGEVYGASTRLDKVEIAGVKFYDISASVNGADLGTSLLGMRFLREFKRYEFYQDKLILEI